MSIFMITQSLGVILNYNQNLDLDWGPREKSCPGAPQTLKTALLKPLNVWEGSDVMYLVFVPITAVWFSLKYFQKTVISRAPSRSLCCFICSFPNSKLGWPDLEPNWTRLAPNMTTLGFFQIRMYKDKLLKMYQSDN